MLSEELLYLCKKYYEQLTKDSEVSLVEKREIETDVAQEKSIYCCEECLTLYDESYGDSMQGVEPNTSFSLLPETWHCPVCEAPKTSFKRKKFEKTKVLL